MRHFQTWSDEANRPEVCTRCLAAVLEGRAAYLNQKDPTWWRRGDIRALLLDLIVPRLSEYCDLATHTVPAIDAYLRFLDETDRLHPGSTAVRYLHHELTQHASGFPAAMADRSRFRMAKTFYQAMLADGVSVDDDEAVDAWMARFNQAPRSDRAAMLEYLLADQPELLTADFAARAGKVIALAPGRAPFDSRDLLPVQDREPEATLVFAPVDVPSRTVAAAAARESGLINDLLTLARWIGNGRKATRDGNPTPPDVRSLAELLGLDLPGTQTSHLHQVPSLKELFWLARQLELIEVRRTGLVAGPHLASGRNGDTSALQDDEEVLSLWQQVLDLVETCREIPEEAPASARTTLSLLSTMTRYCVPEMMASLYRSASGDQDQQVDDLISPHVQEHLERLIPAPEDDDEDEEEEEEKEMAITALKLRMCLSLDRLIEHGVLELSGPGLAELDAVSQPETQGLPMRAILMGTSDQLRLRLTPLGRWGIRESLRADGAEAPASNPDVDSDRRVLDLNTSVTSPSS